MMIKGVFEVDGVRILVDVDIPAGQREVYVTNVSAQCLVIPRERWRLDLLDLNAATLGALTSAGMKTLDDLVSDNWELKLPDELLEFKEAVERAVIRLRSVALTFDPLSENVEQQRSPFPIPAEQQRRLPPVVPQGQREDQVVVASKSRQQIPLSSSLTTIGVSGKIAKTLSERGAATIGQLLERGRSKLVMTPGLKSTDVNLVERKLLEHGFSWPAREAAA